MAYVADPEGAFMLHVNLIDSGLDRGSLTFRLVEAAVYADAVADAQAIIALLEAVTTAEIVSYSVSGRTIQDAVSIPVTGVEMENRATIIAQSATSPLKTATVVIPAAAIGLFQATTGAGHNLIDQNDTDLLAYLNIWQETGALASLSDGEFLADTAVFRSGKRTHRKSSDG